MSSEVGISGDDCVAVALCDRQAWEALAAEADPGFYGQPGWLETACAASGLEPRYVLVKTRNAPLLRVALAFRRRWGQQMLLTPALAAYAGWAEVFPADLAPERVEMRRREAFDELAEWCEGCASFVRIVLPPEVTDVRPFLWRGWWAEVRYTYRISHADDSALTLRTNHRRNLERAQNSGLTVLRPRGAEAADMLDATVRATFARQGEPLPVPEAAWRAYLEKLADMPSVRVVAVLSGEIPLATAALGYDPLTKSESSRAYELLAGTSDEGIAQGAGVLALWTAIRDSAAEVPEFDFAGANIPSIAHFKRGFGGRLVPYFAVMWARSAAARWLAVNGPAWKRRVRRVLRSPGSRRR